MAKRVTKKEVLNIYQKKACNVSATCSAAGISRRTFYKWKEKDEKFREACEEGEESLIDFAESQLLQKVNDGDLTAIIFILKTKGKNRGYVERTEQKVDVNPWMELMESLPDKPE